jgi:hypothetical protein
MLCSILTGCFISDGDCRFRDKANVHQWPRAVDNWIRSEYSDLHGFNGCRENMNRTRRSFLRNSTPLGAGATVSAHIATAFADKAAASRTPHKYPKLILSATGRKGDFDQRSIDDPIVFYANGAFQMLYIGWGRRPLPDRARNLARGRSLSLLLRGKRQVPERGPRNRRGPFGALVVDVNSRFINGFPATIAGNFGRNRLRKSES